MKHQNFKMHFICNTVEILLQENVERHEIYKCYSHKFEFQKFFQIILEEKLRK